MSVILKALQKLEQETSLSMSADFHGAEGHPIRRKSRLAWGWVLAGGLLLLLIGLVAFWMIHPLRQAPGLQHAFDPGITSARSIPLQGLQDKVEDSIPATHGPQHITDDGFSGAPSQPATEDMSFPMDEEGHGRSEALTASEFPPERNRRLTADEALPFAPPPPAMEKEVPPPDIEVGSMGLSIKMESAREDGRDLENEPAPSSSGPVSPAVGLEIDVLKDPALELQAISWSSDAARRLAIINGKICREKETIGGYVVDTIQPEAVVVSNGGKRGRLVFQIR